jgi:hypothetical protein
MCVCLSVTLNTPLVVLFSRKNGLTDFDQIFVVVKKSTPGDIGYLKLSNSILIQNDGSSKLCLLCCTVGHGRERLARPRVCMVGVVCVMSVCVCDGCGVCVCFMCVCFVSVWCVCVVCMMGVCVLGVVYDICVCVGGVGVCVVGGVGVCVWWV